MITFFGITFYLYGFIAGLACVIGLLVVEYQFKKSTVSHYFSERRFWQLVTAVFIGGVIGARLWHVATDFHLYQSAPGTILKAWQGGLSILGAVAGGIFSLTLYLRLQRKNQNSEVGSLTTFLDLAVFGLPFAQAIGRIGNYVNQELYGLPTTLPWGITINGGTYHPLWAYEALLMLLFGVGVWLFERSQSSNANSFSGKIGSGNYFLAYLFYYSFIRFWLDFLRIEKTMSPFLQLGVNQVVLLSVWALMLVIFGLKYWMTKPVKN